MKYRMVGIDLDGTLLDSRGQVSQVNLAAIRKAQQAGVVVVPCTGRSWGESREVLTQLTGVDLGVFITGAVVGCTQSGDALDISGLDVELALELVRFLEDLPQAVLVYQESKESGANYLVAGRGALTPNTRWWFQTTGASVIHNERVDLCDLEGTMRVGIVAKCEHIHSVVPEIQDQFGDRVLAHSFEAVTTREAAEPTHVLEIFAQGVDKWRGLRWIAQKNGISPEQVAVIGDQVNDLGMFRGAGCAIAMDNAPDQVKAEADYHTGHCDQDGVSQAMDRLLDGRWGQ